MAQRGKRLDDWTRQRIQRLAELLSVRQTAREAGVSTSTVWKYLEKNLNFDTAACDINLTTNYTGAGGHSPHGFDGLNGE